ncbi:MAG: hypothetical protein IJC07_00420 [Clostridia bacterium]|nr:hypothetical protein [Clostridia bacterium]
MNLKKNLTKTAQFRRLKENNRATLTIHKSWCSRFDLSANELLIFEEIHFATHRLEKKAYTGSRTGLGMLINATLPTVDRALLRLEEKGFIRKEFRKEETVKGAMHKVVQYISMLPADLSFIDPQIEKTLETNMARREAMLTVFNKKTSK